MDFQARQYDPQIGRFLSVDPKAAAGGQEVYSPYAAMGNQPEMMIDPNGEMPGSFSSANMREISNINLLGGFYNSQTVIDMLGMIGSYVGSSGKIDPDFTAKFEARREYERRAAAAGQNYSLGLYQLAVANYLGNFSSSHMMAWYDEEGGEDKSKTGYRGLDRHKDIAKDICTWEDDNFGRTLSEIVSQKGFSYQIVPNGPNIRYVFDPLYPSRVIDMRYMLVVGGWSKPLGNGIESF